MKVQDILISAFTAATVAVGATFLIDANKNQSDKHQSYSVEDMFTTLDFRVNFHVFLEKLRIDPMKIRIH